MKIDSRDLDVLLEAHLQKPEKVAVYKPRVEANMVNGVAVFKATWSWWAFFATWAYFLYRKMYIEAGVLFILNVISSFIPGFFFIIMIFSGVSAFYFYTKKFLRDLQIAEYGSRPIDEVCEKLKVLGGYNSWVVWVSVLLNILALIPFLVGFLSILMVSSGTGNNF